MHMDSLDLTCQLLYFHFITDLSILIKILIVILFATFYILIIQQFIQVISSYSIL